MGTPQAKSRVPRVRFIDFFAGIGGFALGLTRAGHQLVGACEIDPEARKVYEARHGHKVQWEDVTNVDAGTLPRADLWTAGFPCQDLSPAGPRTGFDGTRSRLVFDFLDLADKARPDWLLLENSRGMLHVGGGRHFGRLLGELDERGYVGAWRVLDALRFGVPQRRRRVYVLARRAGASGPSPEEVLQVGARCKGHSPARRGEGAEFASCLTTRPGRRQSAEDTYVYGLMPNGGTGNGAGLGLGLDESPPLRATNPPGVAAYTMGGAGAKGGCHPSNYAYTLTTNGGWGAAAGGTILAFDGANITSPENRQRCDPGGPSPTLTGARRTSIAYGPPPGQEGAWLRILMPVECERLQGFPDGWTDGLGLSDDARYRLLGNSVAEPVIRWIGGRLPA